jgi:adenylosuccinate synthase
LHDALDRGARVLIEGAQGTMLDVGYGTYPFVTSSHTIAGGACVGLGLGPTAIGNVVGVAKAYCTRVGAGPLPSELHDEAGARLRERGHEFGTVTGRPRRCGWFDAVVGRYAVRLNGLASVVVTKLDVLSGFERVGIVRGYVSGGRQAGIEAIADSDLTTEVEWYDGWPEDLSSIRRIADLPPNARRYVAALEAHLGVPLEAVSLGPERAALATA